MITRVQRWWRDAGWNEFVLLLALAVFSAAAWGFIELADDAPEGDYLETEAKILRAFRNADDPTQGIGPSWMPLMARDVTALGGAVTLTLLSLLVIGFLLLRHRHRSAVLVLVAMLGGLGLSLTLKAMFERERPSVVPHLMEESSQSFPSGHSMLSSVAYLTLGTLLAQTSARRREKIYVVAAAVFLTCLIGVSRVYLGVHYPTDVLAGWSAGTMWALICWGAAAWLQRRGAIATPEQAELNLEESRSR